MYITVQCPCLRNDRYYVEWDVKPYSIPYHTICNHTISYTVLLYHQLSIREALVVRRPCIVTSWIRYGAL